MEEKSEKKQKLTLEPKSAKSKSDHRPSSFIYLQL
jgi:hypothetical protein